MQISLITGNQHKAKEVRKYLGAMIDYKSLELDELQSMDLDTIAEYKAKQAWERIHQPVIVWDQAVHIACLNGFPGPLIKWFWEAVTLEKICEIAAAFDNYAISTTTTLTFTDGKKLNHFRGVIKGFISAQPRGTNGFAWDRIFMPEGSRLTWAEMDENDPLYHNVLIEPFKALKEYLLKLDTN